ncbi:hypothetical protein GCK72_012682 [Caenorhabditis remanei]|uniref:Uncharacterized protein n=1 Tax=Caenorhabditis remanei TaxID=31234 RepID=A0A6A5GP34_CAERE|nr:hypothetical protein GCK72_012682 [Caenorhabditis remanei]KAF1756229.1 hypothetical protein GCK72_012682 [Caenorhabditis remanei]
MRCWTEMGRNLKQISRKEFSRRINSGKEARRFNKRKYTSSSRNNDDRTLLGFARGKTSEQNETSFDGENSVISSNIDMTETTIRTPTEIVDSDDTMIDSACDETEKQTITPRSSECVQLLRHLHAARSSQKSFDESRRRFHSWKRNWRRVDLLRDVVKYGTQDEPADRELLAALAHTRWLMLSVESGNPHPESLVDLHEQFGRANICRAALASYDGMYFLFKWNQKEQKG